MAGVKENYHQLKSDLIKVKHTLDLVAALPRFFREQITVQQAEEDIKRLLDTREERFLELVRSQIYERPDSPYLPLLRNAGCEFSDLESNVHRSGLEETLAKLAGEGVYLTSDEFKGKKEITRGRQSFRVSPDRFERRDFHPGFVTHSSGTRNQPVRSMTSLDWIATRTPAAGIFIYAHDLFSHSHALYDAILPASGFFHLFFLAKLGKASDRWFARKIPVRNWLEGRFHELATSLMVFMGKRYGPGFPKPELIDVGEIDRIVRWVESTRRAGKNCFITTVASSAARIARVASQMGISLEGTKISVAGEPLTEFKEQVIKDAGASITSRYSYGGAVTVGFGCANPSHRDEIHVSQDLLALISHSRSVGGGDSSIAPLLCTTLHPLAP
ncbi:MAG: hypothetical protein OEN50_09680, partial [Deltaproteobacteria bacterium]|nr:hypothetical protein [Deltaproteobacteria bacterium]